MRSLFHKARIAWQILRGTRSFALDQMDLKLRPFCSHRRGFFVEAGANDGVVQSNTLYYERYRGWSGLLVEPIPALAARCRRNRPRSIVESCALVAFDYPESTVRMTYCDLMSVVRGAMKSPEEEQDHVRTGAAVQGIEPYALEAPARTLTSVLDQHVVPEIDLLSLDVEGYEANVLRGLDFDRYRPALMLVETRYRTDIDALLDPLYEPVAALTGRDILYRSRRPLRRSQS
jgi:FkbM family methyltransferase